MSQPANGSIPTEPLPAWRVRASQTVLDSPWLKVRADHCVTEDGHTIAPYYVLTYPDWALVVATDTEGQIILVRQYRHGVGATSTELPCGGVDKHDADPVAAGKRELLEETGYGGGQWRYAGRLAANPATQVNYCHIIIATGVSRQAEPVKDATEELQVVRTSVQAAKNLALEGGILQAIHVAALLTACELHGVGR